jgi:hypothetical protein
MLELNPHGMDWQGILHTSLRQIEDSSGALEYLDGAAARHQLLHIAAADAASHRAEALLQVIQRSAQLTKGSLNQFLSTPIKSDEEDVRRILADAFLKFSESVRVTTAGCRMITTESRMLAESALAIGKTKADALLRSILANGKQQLVTIGFKNGKWRGELYSTTIAAKTNEIGISIEEIILSTMTAEAKAGKSIALPNPLSVWNMQLLRNTPLTADEKGLWEIGFALPVLAFDSRMPLESMLTILEATEMEYRLHGISLSRGLLPATTSEHYVISVRISPDGQLLREIVRWFFSQDGMKSKENATILHVREILFEKAT